VSGRPRGQRGSITPLVIGFFLVVATLVGVVVDAAAAYLRRQGLDALADAAALAATEGLQGEQVYTSGLGEQAAIDPVTAERYVVDYVRHSGAARQYAGLRCEVSTHGTTVVVRLSSPVELPLHVPGIPLSATVAGTAAAVVVIGR
jgi:uncharacterized membrane protein